jgi:hypothetical protein
LFEYNIGTRNHESGNLVRTKEISLSFGRANEHRNPNFTCCCENRLQQD